jgi:HPr kinase/phosphorylase
MSKVILHATAIAIGGHGVLLRGPSGAGKSDLALRLITAPLRLPGMTDSACAQLIGDDQVVVRRLGEGLVLAPHPRLAGLLEVRGLGILYWPPLPSPHSTPLSLVLDLTPRGAIARMPEPTTTQILGVDVTLRHVDPFEAAAVIKVHLMMAAARL